METGLWLLTTQLRTFDFPLKPELMTYRDAQSSRNGCVVVAACGLGFAALVFLNMPFGDPGVHVAWEEDFASPVESDCIEEALRSVTEGVRRTSYVSSGTSPRGFDSGVTVTQFNYPDPTLIGGYSLDIGRLPNGVTHYWHEWGKIGTDITEAEKAQVIPLLNRANDAVARHCGLSFSDSGPREGEG